MTRYEQGFIKRAEELGYDGVGLLKLARKIPLKFPTPKAGINKLKKDLIRYWTNLSGKRVRLAEKAESAARANRDSHNKKWRKYVDLFERRNREASDLMDKMYDNGETFTLFDGTKLTPLTPKKNVSPEVIDAYTKVEKRIEAIRNHMSRVYKEGDEVREALRNAGGELSFARNARNAARLNTAIAGSGAAGLTGGVYLARKHGKK